MNPEYEKISEQPDNSFTVRWIERQDRPLLSQAWHYHPEIEICLTLESEGKRFVGNRIDDYFENDLVIFGTNLPHGFITDKYCKQVVIQFKEDFLGQEFLNKPEMRKITTLFDNARSGMEFGKQTTFKASKIIKSILKSTGMKQTILLLSLLDLLTDSDDNKNICSIEYAIYEDESNLKRVKVIYDHIIENFRKDVQIKEVADKINLSESAFYKFIKKHTKKTYTQIINEFRINYASKLLIKNEHTISQACYKSGFNNLSYFNRKFKFILGVTPHDFRNNYLERTGKQKSSKL